MHKILHLSTCRIHALMHELNTQTMIQVSFNMLLLHSADVYWWTLLLNTQMGLSEMLEPNQNSFFCGRVFRIRIVYPWRTKTNYTNKKFSIYIFDFFLVQPTKDITQWAVSVSF
jgi:hypothetical protein